MAGLYIGVRFLAIMGKKTLKNSLCRHNSRFLIDFYPCMARKILFPIYYTMSYWESLSESVVQYFTKKFEFE